jgi:hypothetical protein
MQRPARTGNLVPFAKDKRVCAKVPAPGTSMTTTAETQARAPQRRLQILLIVVAAAEALAALSSLPGVAVYFMDDFPTAQLRFAQGLLSVKYALAPFLAVPAFNFAVKGRLREATLALAGLLLLTWLLDDTMSLAIHGPELSASFGGAIVFAHHFVFPVLALAGGWLALKHRRPALAALLVTLPTVFTSVGFVIFAIVMLIHGF